ncbi:hypothetical protein MPH_13362 [Macrophomina phaseolina MS6]|uniref:Uncharacterized protein n=1 Tax=Macrophomina phaseolina (strain MS6) TaxID=1126212 RepID=K2RYT9_MACPH|nr:hypothetical protein MPH_13362 [Macrophomina phaseolina MS6]
MPRRKNIPTAIFHERFAVAQGNETYGDCCPCTLSLLLDQGTDSQSPHRGALTIWPRQPIQFEGLDINEPIALRLPLEIIESIDYATDTIEGIPSTIRNHIAMRHAARREAVAITLTVKMSAPGCVIVPKNVSLLTPMDHDRADALAFRRLCEATEIQLYIHANDAAEVPETALNLFSALAQKKGMLASKPSDLRRMYKNRGARETTWKILNVSDPPPAYPHQPQRSTGKRTREGTNQILHISFPLFPIRPVF